VARGREFLVLRSSSAVTAPLRRRQSLSRLRGGGEPGEGSAEGSVPNHQAGPPSSPTSHFLLPGSLPTIGFHFQFRDKKVILVRKLVVLLFVLALLAAACSGGGAIVATFNGTDITLGEVEALRPDTATVARQDFADDLFVLIFEEALRQGGRELGVVEDQAAIDTFYADYVANVEGTLNEFLEANNITEETLRHFAFQQVIIPTIREKLAEASDPVDEADIQAAYSELLPNLTTVCTRHILVATEDEATAVLGRLDGGEDFGDLAAELSTDTGSGANGGDVGCMTEAEMTQTFVAPYTEAALTAPIGEVTDPVQSDFGYHVMIVDSRDSQPLDEIRVDLEAALINQQGAGLFDEWVAQRLGAAEIVVTERYGTWQTEPSFGVISPA